jgi:sorbitol/mannitol transport system substrate-binding protein
MKQLITRIGLTFALCLSIWTVGAETPKTLVIATVDNGHMLTLQTLSSEFERSHPDVRLRWVILPETELRKVVASDLQTQARQFDVVTIGMLEAHVFAKRGWLQAIRPPANYDTQDLLVNIREGLSYQGELYAAPFYGESSMLFYRKDLLAKAGLKMPAQPTWAEVASLAARLHDPQNRVNGICLRGKPGWGGNMTLVATMANTFGGQFFDMQWRPQLQTSGWKEAVSLYVDLLRRYGPADAVERGYNENLELFNNGNCALWVDASVASGFISDPRLNPHATDVGFAPSPIAITSKGSRWLWAWAFAVPTAIDKQAGVKAQKFVAWVTSREYVKLVASTRSWEIVPSGTRMSTYTEQAFQRAAPWAKLEFDAINSADPHNATLNPSPYMGVQFPVISEYAPIGDAIGQAIADAVIGRISINSALARSQSIAQRYMALRYMRTP